MRSEELTAGAPTQLFIAGKWCAADSGAQFAVDDPATGRTIAAVSDGGPSDARRALDAASAAQASWAATSPRQRSELLRAAWEQLVARTEDFARLMTMEMGKPLAEARGEVAYGAEFLRWFSEEAVRVAGRYGTNPEGTGQMIVSRHPVGPCYLITPWNFPLAMATRKVAPALAAGCTVVLKPAEATPLTALALAEVFRQVGLPDGVLNVVPTADPGALSTQLMTDARLRKVSFTGSTPVGVALMQSAAEGMLRTSLELGGNAPFLVFDDADLGDAVEGAMIAKFRNIGQACTAANRFLVHESLVEEFSARLAARVSELSIGPGSQPGVDIGPLINDAAVEKAEQLVNDAVDRGAQLLAGGTRCADREGSFFPATVLSGVPVGSRILSEEVFGPVLAITGFSAEAEAVELANATEYGLVAYAYTRDLARTQRLIESLETGMLGLNVGAVSNAAAPFGGVKMSGIGREGGVEGIGEFLSTKYTLTPDPFAR